MREFFGKPFRDISKMCYPDKITLEEFIQITKDNLDGFKKNMQHLKFHPNEFIEKHMERFLAWSEIEND